MKNRLFAVLVSVSACGGTEPADDQPPEAESPRVLDGLQALYMFDEGEGLIVHDSSGVEPAFDLQLDNLVTNAWVPEGGVEIVGSSVITSTEVAEKVFVACVQANAVSIEAWIEPANITQTGTIFTYSKNNDRNVTVDVESTRYRGAVRTSNPDPLATEPLDVISTVQTPEDIAAPATQHIVYTRNQTKATIYVNGVEAIPPPDPNQPPPMAPPATDQNGWSPTYQLVFGNETEGNRPWLGKIFLAAVYCRDLTGQEVQKNFTAGFAL